MVIAMGADPWLYKTVCGISITTAMCEPHLEKNNKIHVISVQLF